METALEALRELQVQVRFHVQMKAQVCDPVASSHSVRTKFSMIDWCCDQEYEVCAQAKNQINVCTTNFASANANVSIAEANAVESSSTSSSSLSATSLSSISSTLSTIPSQGIFISQIRKSHLLIKRTSHHGFILTGVESVE